MTRYKHLFFPPFCSMLVKQASYAWSGGHSWINSGFLWIRCQQKIASKVWEASYHNKFICKLLLTSQSWAHESKGNTDNSHALAFNARCFFAHNQNSHKLCSNFATIPLFSCISLAFWPAVGKAAAVSNEAFQRPFLVDIVAKKSWQREALSFGSTGDKTWN